MLVDLANLEKLNFRRQRLAVNITDMIFKKNGRKVFSTQKLK